MRMIIMNDYLLIFCPLVICSSNLLHLRLYALMNWLCQRRSKGELSLIFMLVILNVNKFTISSIVESSSFTCWFCSVPKNWAGWILCWILNNIQTKNIPNTIFIFDTLPKMDKQAPFIGSRSFICNFTFPAREISSTLFSVQLDHPVPHFPLLSPIQVLR